MVNRFTQEGKAEGFKNASAKKCYYYYLYGSTRQELGIKSMRLVERERGVPEGMPQPLLRFQKSPELDIVRHASGKACRNRFEVSEVTRAGYNKACVWQREREVLECVS